MKDFQENENTLTPEERVREDISAKIADAAAEVQEEIDAAEGTEVVEDVVEEVVEAVEGEEMPDSWSDEAWEEAGLEEVKPEPVKVTIKKSSWIASLIGAAVAGALVLLLCLQIPGWIKSMPEGSKVASVYGSEITDLDVKYYMYANAANYMNENQIQMEDVADYDWNQEIEGEKLADKIRKDAIDDAIEEAIILYKAEQNGVTLSDEEKTQLDTQVNGIISTYGEDGFGLRARTMGISSVKQYAKMYAKVMALQKAEQDISKNADAYLPEDTSVLNDYIQPDGATVKHILIKNDAPAEGEPAEDKRALAQSVLDRINAGEDFDALLEEFNEDPGATPEGYTFGPGEMVPEFEQASFALKIGEVSGIVESSHGYHIIKRMPGMYELEKYWVDEASKDIKIKNGKLNKLSVVDVMSDVKSAIDELEAEAEAAEAAGETAE